MILRYAIIISLTINTLTMLIKVPEPKKQKKQDKVHKVKVKIKSKDKDKNSSSDDKDKELFIESKKLIDKLLNISNTLGSNKSRECEKHYIGIGITYSYLSNTISDIAPGGPADRAGIKVGDRLADPSMRIRNQYPIGTSINVAIIKDGRTVNISVKVDKICTSEKP